MEDYKSREQFLATLTGGDKVAAKIHPVRSGFLNTKWGYQILTLVKITPSRAKFVARGEDSSEQVFDKNGSIKRGSGHCTKTFYLVPVTAEVMESIRLDRIYINVDSRKCRLIEQLMELRDSFATKDEMFHLEFLAASNQLIALLDKHTKAGAENK